MYYQHKKIKFVSQAGVFKTKTLRPRKLENKESKPKPSIWLTLGLKTNFRPRVSQIEGFGLLSSFSSLRGLRVFVFKTPSPSGHVVFSLLCRY